jgi:hypothetical protein
MICPIDNSSPASSAVHELSQILEVGVCEASTRLLDPGARGCRTQAEVPNTSGQNEYRNNFEQIIFRIWILTPPGRRQISLLREVRVVTFLLGF